MMSKQEMIQASARIYYEYLLMSREYKSNK